MSTSGNAADAIRRFLRCFRRSGRGILKGAAVRQRPLSRILLNVLAGTRTLPPEEPEPKHLWRLKVTGKSIVGLIILMISFQWSGPEEIRCPGARHRVRSCQRRAADKQQSTGLLHLHLRISLRVIKKEAHPKRCASFLVDPRRFELPTPTMRM